MLLTPLRWLARLWRLSALRQALLLTVVFLAVIAGAAGYAVFEVREEIDNRVDNRLQERFDDISADIADGVFTLEDAQATSLERVLFLPDTNRRDDYYGERGTFTEPDLIPREGRPRGGGAPESWLFYGGAVQGGWLIVGQNIGEVAVFNDVLVETFVTIGWVTVAVALLLGLFFGWRTQRRLTEVTNVLEQAAAGDVAARVRPAADRDDLDRLGLQVDDALTRIGAALEQARGFSANIAHDLKTPLTRLRIRLETALLADGDRSEEIGAALEQADKSIAIFDAFLRLSKLESGALEQRFEAVDLAALVGEAAETFGPVIEDSGRTLNVSAKPGTVQGDPVLLNQFLSNLIQNALRYTPTDATLTLVSGAGFFGLDDDGPGIPEAERARVTEPLYRMDRSRNTDGAGLGLALAKSIAARHGASLVLKDTAGTATGLSARMVWDAGAKTAT